MTKGTVVCGAFAAVLVVLALGACRAPERDADSGAADSPDAISPTAAGHEGLLHGRVTTDDGDVYEGRLRWGGDEEALWGHTFNGLKDENAWAAHAPAEELPKEGVSIELFGIELLDWERELDLGRPFMARFGDITRIEPRGRDVRVTLKSGAVFDLDRFSADDLADGVRVWDDGYGVVDLGEWGIRAIELLPGAGLGPAPHPLHGTVRTQAGDFTGLIQWNREQALRSDELHGRTPDGELVLAFDAVRSIARRSRDSAMVTLLDGREIVLEGGREVGDDNRGIYVDDPRYGRVLVSWDAFERVDFSPGPSGPAYGDFPPGRPLRGSVVTRSGRRLAGRLVYDLDESETTETLDAPWRGVDYIIPFGLIASIVPANLGERGSPGARVTLHSGEELALEPTGDLGEANAGMLVFSDGRPSPEYVSWTEVERIDLDRPPLMYPPSAPR